MRAATARPDRPAAKTTASRRSASASPPASTTRSRVPSSKRSATDAPAPNERPTRTTTPAPGPTVERVDASYLEGLIGYNARRAALAVIAVFLERLAPFGLRPVDFSILSLITHNPGITARQLCSALGILPPNMVGVVSGFERRGLVERRPHPTDRRAQGLHLTDAGRSLMATAERTASALEQEVAHRLTAQQQKTLMSLLQKIYL